MSWLLYPGSSGSCPKQREIIVFLTTIKHLGETCKLRHRKAGRKRWQSMNLQQVQRTGDSSGELVEDARPALKKPSPRAQGITQNW